MQFWQFLGDLHPKLVQFPLVLLLAGLLFDLLGLVRRSEALHLSAKILSAAGTFFLLIAFICGIYAEIWAARAGMPQEQIEWHELMANIASWGFVILMAWRLFLEPANRKTLLVYTLIGLSWYSLLVVTGYFGGRLVFDYGAAVTGGQANNVLSMEDLNILATRQTDLNLRYSEMMHHIFGWLTLALSGSLFAYALFPKKADKLKWVGPALLLIGGIFLFFFADRDLYPNFLDPHQLRDREVQLHKTLALIMTVVGGVGLWRLRRHHRGLEVGAVANSPTTQRAEDLSDPGRGMPSKVVAVMALIGGAMLFTHVHTVAPYANVAAGVYIAHVVLGLTALGIGITRLAQDGLPRYRHAFALCFAVLMCFESVLLITYNEGLPWYIGYGEYNRWGPHRNLLSSTVAPYGPIRAELTFDPPTQKMDLYVLDRDKDMPVAVPASMVNVLISHGYTETAIPLAADMSSATDPPGDPTPRASHFSAIVPSMKNTVAFSARAALPVGSSMKMGYFDPWVTKLINPVPPNETARYQCPMHDGIISENPGTCPLCGMPLVPILTSPPTSLHESRYNMTLATTPSPGQIHSGERVLLRFTPYENSKVLHNLIIVHEHILHLIIVSSDLNYFDHVHPVMQADGSLTLPYVFPKQGTYLLFADCTPAGQRHQVFRLPVVVRGEGDADEPQLMTGPASLTASPAMSHPLPDEPTMTAELIFQPRTPVAGLHTDFLFRLRKDGRPVNDLQPYIGAMGHCVIISQDTQTYLHCHPEQLTAPTPDARGGPDVPFHTVFPHPGLYKIWGQFRRGERILVVTFVVDVKSPILPPRVINFLLGENGY